MPLTTIIQLYSGGHFFFFFILCLFVLAQHLISDFLALSRIPENMSPSHIILTLRLVILYFVPPSLILCDWRSNCTYNLYKMFGFIQSGLEPQYPTLQTSNNESYKVFGLIRLRFKPESAKLQTKMLTVSTYKGLSWKLKGIFFGYQEINRNMWYKK